MTAEAALAGVPQPGCADHGPMSEITYTPPRTSRREWGCVLCGLIIAAYATEGGQVIFAAQPPPGAHTATFSLGGTP